MTRRDYLALVSGERRGPVATLARLGLRAASWPYRLAMWQRNRRFDAGRDVERAGVPVVSVGNLTVGGTGKTPCVAYLARYYRDLGRQVAILSRGYGGSAGPNDEALVLEDQLPDVPHLQGADRVALARTAVEELESDLLLLDDGFQHRRLARDLDVVLLDATNPWGYGRLLPAGLLREPPGSLKRAGVVLLTRCDQTADLPTLRQRVAELAPQAVLAESVHQPTELLGTDGQTAPVANVNVRAVGAFAGIGNPAAFRATLGSLGAKVTAWREYADHHPYTRDDVAALEQWAATLPADALVLTTEKDFVKLRLPALAGRPLWAVRIGLTITAGATELHSRLTAVTDEH